MDMSAGRLAAASVWESYNQTRGSTHLAGGKPPCLHLQAEMTDVGGAARFHSYLILPSIVLAFSDSVCVCAHRCVYTHSSTHFKIIN